MSDKKEDSKKETGGKKEEGKRYEEKYPENGDNSHAGKEENGALPNNPAKNAELEPPEDEK